MKREPRWKMMTWWCGGQSCCTSCRWKWRRQFHRSLKEEELSWVWNSLLTPWTTSRKSFHGGEHQNGRPWRTITSFKNKHSDSLVGVAKQQSQQLLVEIFFFVYRKMESRGWGWNKRRWGTQRIFQDGLLGSFEKWPSNFVCRFGKLQSIWWRCLGVNTCNVVILLSVEIARYVRRLQHGGGNSWALRTLELVFSIWMFQDLM